MSGSFDAHGMEQYIDNKRNLTDEQRIRKRNAAQRKLIVRWHFNLDQGG
jgi:hypothetical protein